MPKRIEALTHADDGAGLGVLAITHYSRLLTEFHPDTVHILVKGRIVASGGPELADQLESDGYAAFSPDAADDAPTRLAPSTTSSVSDAGRARRRFGILCQGWPDRGRTLATMTDASTAGRNPMGRWRRFEFADFSRLAFMTRWRCSPRRPATTPTGPTRGTRSRSR